MRRICPTKRTLLALGVLLCSVLEHSSAQLSLTASLATSNQTVLKNAQTKEVNQATPSAGNYNVIASLRELEELPELSGSKNADNGLFIRAVEIAFGQDHKELSIYSIGETLFMCLVASVHSSVYSWAYQHRYDSASDLELAAGPLVNHVQCLRHLQNMDSRVKQQQEVDGFRSTDLNLHHMMSSWARAPSNAWMGHMFVEGSYEQCQRTKLIIGDETTEMRYCVLSLRSADWPLVDIHNLTEFKAGICIPKTCDSADYKNKYDLIQSLAASQLQPMDLDNLRVSGLYCLPDEDSQLRSVWHSQGARLTVVGIALWISLLAFATYKYRVIQQQNQQQQQREKTVAGAEDESSEAASKHAAQGYSQRSIEIYRMLSITNNFRLLFNTTKESSLTESSSSSSKSSATQQASTDSFKFVDLRCIEGIKVIAMCYVIMGHVIMCMPTIAINGRDLAEQGLQSLALFIANLVPAFAVNSFFVITGLLTSYLMLKQNKASPMITSSSKWVALIVYRYLRIMPMYALVVLYCKHLAKFTGTGPIWDYGTSALSQRRICEQEPWHWTLTFTSNFISPMRHCIPGGWYLSNDVQFLLVTPIFMVALHLRPRLGKALLYASILAGYLAGFFSIYLSNVTDLRPIAQFLPYGFKTYVSHLSYNYTHPQYRIPAYLLGLLVGYKLFELEELRRSYNELSEEQKSRQVRPCWPEILKRYGAYLVTFLLVGCCVTPYIGRLLTFNKFYARLMVAFITPSYHILYAFAIAMLLMLCTTGHGNRSITRFLASPYFKPFARLSLCAVLVNVEVINYIIQSHTRLQYVTNSYIIMLNSVCIIGTYLASIVLCVLFEAPIRSALNTLLASLMASMSRRQKSKIC